MHPPHNSPPPGRTRVLFIPEGVTLAHVGRMLTLASALNPTQFDVQFACADRYIKQVGETGLTCHPITTISTHRFLRALYYGTPMYDGQVLARYVNDERDLISQICPDVVIGDFRLTLDFSAALEQVPYINIVNAYWSPYRAQTDYPTPDSLATKLLGVTIARHLLSPIFSRILQPFNALARKLGLPTYDNLHALYANGPYVGYPDAPELVPCRTLPSHHRYLGPVLWSPNAPTPAWWNDIPEQGPCIYLSMGSSGSHRALKTIISALSDLPVRVLYSSAGAPIPPQLPSNFYAAPFLPGNACMARSTLAIHNGGSGSVYQALTNGTPMLGVPGNLDQYLSMQHVVDRNCGMLLRSGNLTSRQVQGTVETLLEDPGIRRSAEHLQSSIAHYRPEQTLVQWLCEIH